MNRNPSRLIPVVATTLVTGGLSHAAVDGQTGNLDEIVVTASKREEKLSNVPSAVSAIGADTIETLGITKIDDYIGLIPNVAQYSLGAPGSSVIIIRGLYTGSSQLTSTTAYYLDDAALTASGTDAAATYISPDADLADVERIEVLKGPQSTLYGANALGGILRVISKKPDPARLSGSVGTDFSSVEGGGIGYGVRGSLNLPLWQDKAALRVNVFRRQDPGYYDNLGTGRTNVNESQIEGGRAALRVLPTDRLTIDISGFYQTIHSGSVGIEQDRQTTLTPAFGAYKYSAARDLGVDTRYRTASGAVTYKTDIGTLTATSSYAKYDSSVVNDASAVYAPFVASFAEPGASIFGTASVESKKTTDEIRFASDRLGQFEFLVGAFHTNEDDVFTTNYPIVNPDGTVPAAFGGVLIYSPNPGTYEETSGFGDLTYYLLDNLDVTGGFRYSKNKQVIDSQTFGFFSLFFPDANYNFDDTSRNYLATIRYRPNETTNVYLRAASGYRPGGPNIGATSYPPFTSDTVWNYEAGVKGTLAGGLVSYDAAVYHINWESVQLPGVDPKTSSQIVTNGGSAHVDGAELEATVQPVQGLHVTATVGYNKTKLVSVASNVSSVIGAAPGDSFPLSPRWTGSITADYRQPVTARVDGDVGATFQALGARNTSFPADPTAGNAVLPSYHTIDLRVGAVVDKLYHVTARVENVGNSNGVESYSTTRLFAAEPGVYSDAVRIRPRTYVLSLQVDF